MADDTEEIVDKKIVLCLSGGGLRATFFHLGVIKALYKLDRLKNVTHIYSVSGGSVLAAHLALNWTRYTGSQEQFVAASKKLHQFGARDIRARVINRWIAGLPFIWVPWVPFLGIFKFLNRYFGRSEALEAEYRALVSHANLQKLSNAGENVPQLYMLTTSFSAGTACAFTNHGLISDVRNPVETLSATGNVPVSRAIAASSAFPPLFPPVKITRDAVNGNETTMPSREMYLTDGGVFDNLGLDVANLMQADSHIAEQSHIFIVSDASAPFSPNEDSDFSDLISRTVRTTDILMNRVTETARSAEATDNNAPIVHLNIASAIDYKSGITLPIDIQTRTARIRTDLDRFSEFEQDVLVQRGYEVCYSVLAEDGPSEGDSNLLAKLESPKALSTAIKKLQKSKRRRLFRPVFADKFFWVLLLYVLLIFGLPAAIFQHRISELFDLNDSLEAKVDQQRSEITALEASKNAIDFANEAILQPDASYLSEFAEYLIEESVTFIEPNRFLVLGAMHNRAALNGIRNAYPPKSAWPNIIPAARALDRLAIEMGEQPEILSAYRTPAYNRALGGTSNSTHLRFQAVDFRFPTGTPIEWAAALKRYRAEGMFKGGIGTYRSFVHVDGRGVDATWEPNATSETVKQYVIRPDTSIFLQFAGYPRTKMIELSTYLNNLGWEVPAFEKGGERTANAAGYNELRHGPGMREHVVEQLLKDMSEGPVANELTVEEVSSIAPGIIEIWVSQ